MYSHYEQRQERTSRDYEPLNVSQDTLSSTLTSSSTYRSAINPRVTHLQRSRPTGLGAAGVSTRIYQSSLSTGGSGGFGPGLASLVHFPGVPLRGGPPSAHTAVVSINTARQRDKRDLVNLNDKFAQYVEKVRFLEAQNRKLALELEVLQSRAGQGSSRIKEMYEIEMAEANKLIDDTKRDAAAAKARTQQLEQELNRQKAQYNDIAGLREIDRRQIDDIQQQIAENEAQIALFRRRIADLEDESRRYKAESQRISSEIAHLQNEIQNELLFKSSCEFEKVALEDELLNLKYLHEADLAELRSQSVSQDLDPSQFFRNELSEAIREIRSDYETVIDNQRNDLQSRYSVLFNEIIIRTQQPSANPLFNEQQQRQVERIRNDILQSQNQNSNLHAKNQEIQNSLAALQQKIKDLQNGDAAAKAKAEKDIDEARRRLERIEQDYAIVTEFKTSLEKEISIYRGYLEGPDGLRGCVDRIVQNAEQQALDRPSGNNNPYSSPGGGATTTISRTYINTQGSNYGYRGSSPDTSVGDLINQSSAAPSLYQGLSNTYRNLPPRNDSSENSSARDVRTREYATRRSLLRDGRSSSRESSSRDSSVRGTHQSGEYDTLSTH